MGRSSKIHRIEMVQWQEQRLLQAPYNLGNCRGKPHDLINYLKCLRSLILGGIIHKIDKKTSLAIIYGTKDSKRKGDGRWKD
jgi:hypothetical protein